MGISFPPLVGRLVPLSPAGVLLRSFVLFVVCAFCFDSLRVLLARVVCLFVLFFVLSLLFVCKTLVFDPGVRGTIVGFPVHPWSRILLVLRLVLSVIFVSWRCGVLFLFVFSFARVAWLSCLFVVVGVRGGFSFVFACLPVLQTCVLA